MPETKSKKFILSSGETKEEISNIIVKYINSVIEFDENSKIITKNITTGKDNITSITADTTLTYQQQGLIIANSTSTITINFPTAVNNDNKYFAFNNINSGVVVLDPFDTETLQGDTTVNLFQDESLEVVSYNGNWYIKG